MDIHRTFLGNDGDIPKGLDVYMYRVGDFVRPLPTTPDKEIEDCHRSPFWRDYQRVISSPSFRRLKDKTQLFPGNESDFFRCRLTHSLEVAHIGKSITSKVNYELERLYKENKYDSIDQYYSFVDPDLVQFACIAHDLGHPPFGHQGEEELNDLMHKYGGFEGNAQTLRILCKIEKKVFNKDKAKTSGFNEETGEDFRFGLNATYRSLASILKYDKCITLSKKLDKGYYLSERDLVREIKNKVVGDNYTGNLKTIECQIMDIADDIAYSVYDLEDSFKAGFIQPLDLLSSDKKVYDTIAAKLCDKFAIKISGIDVLDLLFDKLKVKILPDSKIESEAENYIKNSIKDSSAKDFFRILTTFSYKSSKELARIGYYRTEFTSWLIASFISDLEISFDKDHPCLSKVFFSKKLDSIFNGINKSELLIEILKRFTYEFQINSPRLKIVEFRGREIVKTLFKALEDKKYRGLFLPNDVREIFEIIDNTQKYYEKTPILKRIICDFVAGMTDGYALEFYGRLKSESPKSIYKPM